MKFETLQVYCRTGRRPIQVEGGWAGQWGQPKPTKHIYTSKGEDAGRLTKITCRGE
jgi:hypothetical protein